jgi:hypothetical protein
MPAVQLQGIGQGSHIVSAFSSDPHRYVASLVPKGGGAIGWLWQPDDRAKFRVRGGNQNILGGLSEVHPQMKAYSRCAGSLGAGSALMRKFRRDRQLGPAKLRRPESAGIDRVSTDHRLLVSSISALRFI